VAQVAHELKVVVYNKSDFEWAEQHAATVNKDCQLFLQPEWRWQISLQVHKYMNIP
jgi:7-carboxy-7-deazaguanine synthase